MDNSIKLAFTDKTLTNLAGFNYGQEIYEKQVDGKIDINQKYEIIFPDQIKGVAPSFVQGFFKQIVEKIGRLTTIQNSIIISSDPDFEKRFMSKL